MKAEHATRIVQAADDEVTLHEEYSGRCMYGRTTAAVSAESLPALMEAIARAAADLADEVRECGGSEQLTDFLGSIGRLKMDDLGRGTILY